VSACIYSMRSFLARALVSAALVVGCTPKALECGEPATLESHPQRPDFKGAPLGPLLLRNFADDATAAVITEYKPGYALKVVIVVAKPFTSPLTMRGFRCSDGAPLRFADSYPFVFGSTPAPSDVYAAAGELAPVIEPMSSLPPGAVMGAKAPPYMLFTAYGKWVLEVRDGSGLVGRTVLLVR
jgi:hypothetical protein